MLIYFEAALSDLNTTPSFIQRFLPGMAHTETFTGELYAPNVQNGSQRFVSRTFIRLGGVSAASVLD